MGELRAKFDWITWTHVKRELNKTADFMANVAMDSVAAGTLTQATTGLNKSRFLHACPLIQGDLGGTSSVRGRQHTIATAISGTS